MLKAIANIFGRLLVVIGFVIDLIMSIPLVNIIAVLAMLISLDSAATYSIAKIHHPIVHLTLEDAQVAINETIEPIKFEGEEFFIEYGNTGAITANRNNVSFWRNLTPEEKSEVEERVYATDKYFMDIAVQVDSIVSRYEEYIKHPNKAKDKALIDDITQSQLEIDAIGKYNSNCITEGTSLNIVDIYNDNIAIGNYVGLYRRNVWSPGNGTSLDDERDFYVFTYDYQTAVQEYLSKTRTMLEMMKTISKGSANFFDWQIKVSRDPYNFLMAHEEYRLALLDMCTARAQMFRQCEMTEPMITV